MTAQSTPGPWFFLGETLRTRAAMGRKPHWMGWLVKLFGDSNHGDPQANRHLIEAAPAFRVAWSLVPDDVKQAIFNTLHTPETEWVEAAIEATN